MFSLHTYDQIVDQLWLADVNVIGKLMKDVYSEHDDSHFSLINQNSLYDTFIWVSSSIFFLFFYIFKENLACLVTE